MNSITQLNNILFSQFINDSCEKIYTCILYLTEILVLTYISYIPIKLFNYKVIT